MVDEIKERPARDIAKGVQALFNIFTVTRLTYVEIKQYLEMIKPLKTTDPELYALEERKAIIANDLIALKIDIMELTSRRLEDDAGESKPKT